METETHFLLHCKKKNETERETLFNKIAEVCPNFTHLPDDEKLPILLGEEGSYVTLAAQFITTMGSVDTSRIVSSLTTWEQQPVKRCNVSDLSFLKPVFFQLSFFKKNEEKKKFD